MMHYVRLEFIATPETFGAVDASEAFYAEMEDLDVPVPMTTLRE